MRTTFRESDEVVRQHVGRARAEEHEVEGEDGRPEGGADRPVPRSVEELVLGVVAGQLRLDERPHREDAESDARQQDGREEHVRDHVAGKWISQLGMTRSAPSSQPMYQSGCTA